MWSQRTASTDSPPVVVSATVVQIQALFLVRPASLGFVFDAGRTRRRHDHVEFLRFVGDGDAGTVEAYVNDVPQTWSPGGGFNTTPEREAVEGVDRVEAYNDESILSSTTLYVMSDDATTGSEATKGEIDYIHITTN